MTSERSISEHTADLVQELCECQQLKGGGAEKLLVAAMFFSEWGV